MTSSQKNISIIGPGAIGLLFAGLLSRHHKLSLVVKNSSLKDYQEQDLQLKGDINLRLKTSEINVITTDELTENPEDTIYLICVKAYDLDKTLSSLKPYLSKKSSLILTQNGIGIYQQAAEILGRDVAIARVITSIGVNRVNPTNVIVSGEPNFSFSTPLEKDERHEAVFKILSTIGKVERKETIAFAEWEKVLVNIAVNPLCSILNKKNKAIVENQDLETLTLRIVKEARLVAKSEGFILDQLSDQDLLDKISNSRENVCSTLYDLRNGNKTELEYFLGRVIRIANSNQIKTPIMKTLYHLLKYYEESMKLKVSS
ncbi:MAG: ketopantoate reductase family protein [Deltaproteobacteria bacterium]|nr:ketopantoate reductase family protein [Deltaproteobacteria bacterium]